MRKLLFLLQCFLLSVSSLMAADIITVGTGTSAQYVPYGSSDYTTTQFIITKDEIGRSGRITALSFYQSSTVRNPNPEILQIYIGHTTGNTISASKPFTSGLTSVYNLPSYLGESTGWKKFDLKFYGTPFIYNGTDNIVVVVCHKPDEKSYCNSIQTQATSKTSVCITRSGTNTTYADIATTTGYTASSYRPNVKLEMEYFDGSGTEADPFLIKNVSDLDYLSLLVNSGTGDFASKCYKLYNTIDYNVAYTPIGTPEHPFTGTFDGNNYAIRCINFESHGAVEYAGIFGYTYGATIKNLTCSDGYYPSKIVGTLYSGAICAKANGNTIIQNCKSSVSSVSISGSNGNVRAGGICGLLMDDSAVRECINTSSVSGLYAGGIVGYSSDGLIFTSYNTGTISGTSYSGGIAGYNYHDDGGGYIYSCINVGTVSGTTKGNIFGRMSGGEVGNCYWNNSTSVGSYGTDDSRNVLDCAKKDLTTGEVAYLLRTKSYSQFDYYGISGNVWRQNLGSDSYPVLDSSHSMVYYVDHKCCANSTSNITKEYKNSSSTIIDNNLTFHSAVSASCTTNGSIAYYSCNKCGKKYTTSPSSSSSEVTKVSTDPLGHTLVKTEGKDPTPTTSGNHPYWHCTRCNKYFSNSTGTTETTVAAQTIAACPWHYPTYNVPSKLFASGSGFSDDPYLISSAQDLANMAYFVNTTTSPTHTDQSHEMSIYFYKLTNDINLGDYEWTPIGRSSFVGHFDGNNHTISGLKISGTTNSNVGLFGNIGRDGYQSTIEKLTVKGSVSGNSYVGGIVGYMRCATINDCISECTVSGNSYVGGIVGYMYYQTNAQLTSQIQRCTSNSANGVKAGSYAGGIVGYSSGGTKRCIVLSCNNISKVTASTQYAGGIFGYASNSELKASFNRGVITGTYSGALIGKLENSGVIQYNYYLETSCSDAIGSKPSGYAPNNDVFVVYESATSAQCQSGEIAVNLNWGDGSWYQNIGSDAYPVLDASHSIVYMTELHCCKNGSNIVKSYNNTTSGVQYANNLTAHPATSATCTTPGNKAYWTCNACGKLYADANATNETTLSAVTIPVTGSHTFSNGFCSSCGAYQEATLSNGYYEINNAGKLYWFAQKVNSGSTTIKGKLTADITDNTNVLKSSGDLNGTPSRSWIGIGTYTNQYGGTFEGQGHSISGLYYSDTKGIGLFNYADGAHIENVTVKDSYFKSEWDVGGICCTADNNSQIFGCNNYATVWTTDECDAGGIVACCYSSTVEYCNNYGDILGADESEFIGGICGDCDEGSSIVGCINYGIVSDGYNAGGIVGDASDCLIEYCGNFGNVTSSRHAGSICGYDRDNCEIKRCLVKSVSGLNICGNNSSSTTQSDNYTISSTKGKEAYKINSLGQDASGCQWYQNIDKGSVDAYPVLDSSHGTIYGMPDLGYYTNTPIVPATSVTVTMESESAVGQTVTASATILPTNATVNTQAFKAKNINPVTWTSGTASVATVNASTGVVSSKDKGTATITAKVLDGSNVTQAKNLRVYLLGDANGNDKVNVADVATIAAYKNSIAPASWHFAPANANFTDNEINVSDITSTLNIVWNGVPYSAPKKVPGEAGQQSASLYGQPVYLTSGGVSKLNIVVDNQNTQFTAFEFVMRLPEGVHVKRNTDGTLSAHISIERTSAEKTDYISACENEDGSVSVLCYSTNLEYFEGNTGCVATIDLEADTNLLNGEYLIAFDHALLSGCGDLLVAETLDTDVIVGNASGIGVTGMESKDATYVYDVNGRMMLIEGNPVHSVEKLPQGIYIINGKKVIK